MYEAKQEEKATVVSDKNIKIVKRQHYNKKSTLRHYHEASISVSNDGDFDDENQ